jgi:hypothetical protein
VTGRGNDGARTTTCLLALFIVGHGTLALGQAPGPALVVGRNVNMVSGTNWPAGDPYLQRQNEPSVAASTRNPLHLLAGANDYRTVDIPFVDGAAETGDAWLGLFKSFDGGQRWQTNLLPGYPQDLSPAGLASPLKGYQAGADPVVRAGTNGLLYYAGLVFDRPAPAVAGAPPPPQKSAIFVARFIDNNNIENADSIAFLGSTLVASDRGKTGSFLDKPWMAVDIPRGNGPSCRIVTPGEGAPAPQKVPAGTVYVAYTLAISDPAGFRSEIYLSRSTNCGATWTAPMRLSRPEDRINQGASIAIDPRTGQVYVAWRRIATAPTDAPDAILVVKSTTLGKKFSPPGEATRFPRGRKLGLDPARFFEHGRATAPSAAGGGEGEFDQGTTPESFRTNAYPSIVIDGDSRLYLAWAERGYGQVRPGQDGDSRILLSTSRDGTAWTPPRAVVEEALPGHQIMPTLAVGGGRLMLAFYDLRDDVSRVFAPYIDDLTSVEASGFRHTLDLRAATAAPGDTPVFEPSVRVSDYLIGTDPADLGQRPYQLQFNPPNLPMFVQGTAPFVGDYVDLAAAPAFVLGQNGQWAFNTGGAPPVFHAVWTDNRDVRPPDDGDWSHYTPPTTRTSSLITGEAMLPCDPGASGSRNQNIYTARLTRGLLAGSPGNTKPLSTTMARGFVVFAQNATPATRYFRVRVDNQPSGGYASFDQFDQLVTQVDVTTPAFSTASRTVYVTSSDPAASLSVSVMEIAAVGGAAITGGLTDTVTLNPDPSNPAVMNPAVMNPAVMNPDIMNAEVYNPAVMNPAVMNPAVMNPAVMNPAVMNPDLTNPAVMNPDPTNPDLASLTITSTTVVNPAVMNPAVMNPAVMNPAVMNPDLMNPAVMNPDLTNGAISDVSWTVTNNGNTTAVFNVNLFLAASTTKVCGAGESGSCIATQLVVRKTYTTPTTSGCVLEVQTQNILIANVPNPRFLTPSDAGVSSGVASQTLLAEVGKLKRGGSTAKAAGLALPAQNDPSAENATVWLAPGESVVMTLRLFDPDTSDNVLVDGVSVDPVFLPASLGGELTPVIVAEAVDTPAAQAGVTEPAVALPEASTILFLAQPARAVVGTAITPDVTVQVRDASFAPVAGVSVTLTLGTNPGGAVLGGPTTATTDATGAATFSGVTISAPGAGYQLRATAGALAPAMSAPFNVVNANPTPPRLRQLVNDRTPMALPTTMGEPASDGMNAAGDYVFTTTSSALFLRRAGSAGPVRLLQMGDPVPGVPGSVADLAQSVRINAVGDIVVAVEYFWPGGTTKRALLLYDNGVFRTVADSGDVAPGSAGVIFDRNLAVIGLNDAGDTAFSGMLAPVLTPAKTALFVTPRGGVPVRIVGYGDVAPGTGGGTFDEITGVSFNSRGEILFRAAIVGGVGGGGVFIGTRGGVRKVVANGDPDPNGGTFAFATLAAVPTGTLNNSGQVAFVQGARLYLTEPGATPGVSGATVVRVGPATTLPWSPATILSIYYATLNDGGDIAFVANLTGATTAALLRLSAGSGSLQAAAARNHAAPGTGANFSVFSGTQMNNAGRICFYSTTTNTAVTGIFSYDAGTLTAVMVAGQTSPLGGTYNTRQSYYHLTPSGDVYFEAALSGGTADYGAFITTGSGTTTLMSTADPLPAGSKVTMRNLWVSAAGSYVGFSAQRSGGPAGLFVHDLDHSTTVKVVAPGDIVGTNRITSVNVNRTNINQDGAAVFPAGTASSGQSLFVWTSGGGAQLLLAPGDDIDGFGTVTSLSAVVPAYSQINDEGTAVFVADRTGGSGIFVAGNSQMTPLKVVATGDTAPTGGTFTTVSSGARWINHSRLVAFLGTTSLGATGIFVGTPGGAVAKIMAIGDTFIPGVTFSSIYTNLGPLGLNDSGQVVFTASLSDGRIGMFVGTTASVEALALNGGPSPAGGTYNFATNSIDIRINNSGDILFLAPLAGGSSSSAWLLRRASAPGTIETVSAQGQPAPGTAGVFAAWPGSLNSIPGENAALAETGDVAVFVPVAVNGTSRFGLFRYTGPGTLQVVAFRGDPMPDCPGDPVGMISQGIGAGGSGRFAVRVVTAGTTAVDGIYVTAAAGDTLPPGCLVASRIFVPGTVLAANSPSGPGGKAASSQPCATSAPGASGRR